MLAELKLAVTPAGTPLAESAIAELNPFPGVTVKVIDREAPRTKFALARLEESAKVGRTVKLRVWLLVMPPPTAVTVSVETPGAAVEPAEIVKALLPLPGAAMLGGLKPAETPAGAPLTESAIAELKPAPAVVVKATGIEPPGGKLTAAALEFKVKVADDRIVRENGRILSALPPTAPRVSV